MQPETGDRPLDDAVSARADTAAQGRLVRLFGLTACAVLLAGTALLVWQSRELALWRAGPGADPDLALAPWRRELLYWSTATLALLALALAALWRLDRLALAAAAGRAALRESQERLSLALRGSTDAAWDLDLARGSAYYAPRWWEMFGYAADELPADTTLWQRLMHPEDAASNGAAFRAALDQGHEAYEFMGRVLHRDGHYVPVLMRGVILRDAGGTPVRVSGTASDMTARRAAEDEVRRLNAELERRVRERTAELEDSERRFRTIFEAVPVAIIEQDWSVAQAALAGLRDEDLADARAYFERHPDFVNACLRSIRNVRANPAALALYESDGAACELPTLDRVFASPELRPAFMEELAALAGGQRVYTATRSVHSLKGRMVHALLTLTFPPPGEPASHVLVSLTDISALKRLSDALDASLARVTRVNRELETFTYSVSHDLKAPLRGIDGYSRLLLRDHEAGLDEEGRGFLRNIRSATQQMGQLIDDLLAYSRLEQRHLELGRVALRPLVDEILGAVHAELEARGAAIAIDVPALSVRADAQGLAMALRNLVDNALKFTRDAPRTELAIGGSSTDTAVVLWVRDNGLGFDMRFHDRIFEIFQRLHRAEDYPGTGIGLAIVRKAMERMGGRVWATSAPGQGATFHLELPRAA